MPINQFPSVSGGGGITGANSPLQISGSNVEVISKAVLLSYANVEDGADVTDATAIIAAGGVTLDDTQTLTNKTLTTATFTGGTLNSTMTVNGVIDIDDGGSIRFDEAVGTDQYSGIVQQMICGEASGISAGDLVYLDGTGTNRVSIADASSISTMPIFGIAVSSASLAGSVLVLTEGYINRIGWTTFVISDEIYASETAGEVTTTAPTTSGAIVQLVGKCVSTGSSDTIYFKPDSTYLTLS